MGTPAADDLWAKVAAAVRAQLSEATWNTWFQGVHALDLSEVNQRVLLHRARSKVRRALEDYLTGDSVAREGS